MQDLIELRRRFDEEIINGHDLDAIPKWGKSVRVTGMDFMRWREGLVVEHWGELDMLGLLQQLGVIPS